MPMLIDAPTEAPARARKTVNDVLSGAIRYIEEHGWARGNYVNPEGQACIMGAVYVSLFGSLTPDNEQVRAVSDVNEPVQRRLQSMLPDDQTVEDWNDFGARDTADAIDFLRRARDRE